MTYFLYLLLTLVILYAAHRLHILGPLCPFCWLTVVVGRVYLRWMRKKLDEAEQNVTDQNDLFMIERSRAQLNELERKMNSQ